jgi:hypothetical protein
MKGKQKAAFWYVAHSVSKTLFEECTEVNK